MNTSAGGPAVRVGSVAGFLAVVPHLLGFVPESSLVVVGTKLPSGRAQLTLRYDLPDPPDSALAADIAGHAVGVLRREKMSGAVVAGYGPGELVTPVADAFRVAAAGSRLAVRDIVRVQDGRYWSYLCRDLACCPPEGTVFDPAGHPASRAMAAAGFPVLASRAELAATIAPVAGAAAAVMGRATRRAELTAEWLVVRGGDRAVDRPGLVAVGRAIAVYRDGGSLRPEGRHAWLALALLRLPVRDDAWARMDPAYHDAHCRLWTDVVRRAQPGYRAAPASLLAFTAWQGGDGPLASLALDRALADDAGYSLALLLRDAIAAGLPPSAAVMPMTPEEVAASYAGYTGLARTSGLPVPGSEPEPG